MLDFQFEKLIEAGWQVLESDFDEDAFREWRKQATKFLDSLLGSDHTYTKNFDAWVRPPHGRNVLTGVGVLIAAKEDTKDPWH